MKNFEIKRSTQFFVKEIVLVTKAGNIDISSIYEEINIFDSIFSSVISGNILVRDSIGLSSKLLFDGSESLLLEIAKDENSDIATYKKSFRVYKQSKRKNDGLNTETYILNFVSDELMFSDQQRINQSYETTYSDIAQKILSNYLKVRGNNLGGLYEESSGIKKIVIPNLRPLEAIEWCAKRAVDFSSSPSFIFFQNLTGYNFVSLSTLLTLPEILDIKFELKNSSSLNSLSEISSARYMEILNINDAIEKTRNGVNAGKFIGFDPITRTVAERELTYGDHYYNMRHGNETPNYSSIVNRAGVENSKAFNSKKTMSVFSAARKYSNYIKQNDPNSLTKEENIEDWLFQRRALIRNLMSKRIKFVMPGNFQLTSGFNVNVIAPNFGKKEKGNDNGDLSINGKYVIVASRHIIGYDKHETIIEVASSSTGNDFIPASNPLQNSELLEY